MAAAINYFKQIQAHGDADEKRGDVIQISSGSKP
jgi:hypothetical protein